MVGQNLIQLAYGTQSLTLRTEVVKEGRSILGAIITDTQLLIIVTSLVLTGAVWLFVNKTRFGKSMRAVADDPLAANVVGISPEWVILVSFAVGSALAGTAGVLVSLETSLDPTMGFNAMLKGIIAAIIGGFGSIPGAALGGLLLGLAENVGVWKVSGVWKDAIAFGVLILFVLARPQGILGRKEGRS